MKVHLLTILLLVGAALFVPAVSAKIIEEKDGYIVTPGSDSIALTGLSRFSSVSITQGGTLWHPTTVSSGYTAFYSDLNWGNPSNSLALTIYPPGSQLGPYYDSDDGRTDGRITVKIQKSTGLATGTWWSRVYGYSVTGTQSYTYTAYPY